MPGTIPVIKISSEIFAILPLYCGFNSGQGTKTHFMMFSGNARISLLPVATIHSLPPCVCARGETKYLGSAADSRVTTSPSAKNRSTTDGRGYLHICHPNPSMMGDWGSVKNAPNMWILLTEKEGRRGLKNPKNIWTSYLEAPWRTRLPAARRFVISRLFRSWFPRTDRTPHLSRRTTPTTTAALRCRPREWIGVPP